MICAAVPWGDFNTAQSSQISEACFIITDKKFLFPLIGCAVIAERINPFGHFSLYVLLIEVFSQYPIGMAVERLGPIFPPANRVCLVGQFLAFGGIFQFNPSRSVVARFFPSPDITIDAGRQEPIP